MRRADPPPTCLPDGYLDDLVALGRANGLDHVGIAPADVLMRARRALVERKAAGLHDGMQFTYRNPERSTDPSHTVPGARAVLVGARSYVRPTPLRPAGVTARVGRYAWYDHYSKLRDALQVVAGRLRADGWRAVVVADDNAIVDREVAHRAGIGWFGKNANLLAPGHGSMVVLGSVITTAPLPPAEQVAADGCGSCRRCIDRCPTGAIIAPGVIDAHRCLAWVLQKPGTIPVELRSAIGDRIYGCDDCQVVCPPTGRAEAVRWPASATTGDRPSGRHEPSTAWVDVVALLDMTDEEILARYGRWYIAERNPRWLRRNALVVLGNSAEAISDQTVAEAIRRHASSSDPVLREHAEWAARRLGIETAAVP